MAALLHLAAVPSPGDGTSRLL